jgi:hypothetical protein
MAQRIRQLKRTHQDLKETRIVKDIFMYWEKTVDEPVYVPQGAATLKVLASGSSAHGVYPYMIVALVGVEVGEVFLDSTAWKEYAFPVNAEGGVKVLSITFANDYNDQISDRNLFIKEVSVTKNER